MCEGTEISVLALRELMRISLAELAFVSARVVQLFNFIMRELTILPVTALLPAGDVVVLVEVGSAFVLIVVEVQAGLAVMRLCIMNVQPLR